MPYLTLTLSGQEVDLPADAAVALSYRANDLRQLGSREAAFSEQFTLPRTARNVAVLGAPHALDSQTLAPYRLLPAVLTSPGGTELLRGFGILEAAGDGYDITLTDAVGGLFAQVGERPLRTLNLSAYDHPYSLATTQAGQLREDGYTYVLADDGRLSERDPAAGVLWYELTQAVYYRTVLAAIIADALPGYRLTGALLTEPRFLAAVLPRATPTPRLREAATAPYAVQVRTLAARREFDPGTGTGGSYPLIPFPQQLAGDTLYFNGTEFYTPHFPADIRVSARLLVRLDAEHVPAGPFRRAVAAVRIVDSTDPAATAVHEQILYDGILLGSVAAQQGSALRPVEFDFTLPFHPTSRRLAVQLRLEGGAGLTIGAGSTLRFAAGERVYPGAPVHLDASLPDISRADFLGLLLNQFNAVIQADAATQTVRFDLFNDLEKRRGEAVDWSDKIDFQARPALAFRLGDYAQANTFAYAEAPADYEELLIGAPAALAPGSGTLPVPNQTLPPVAEAYAGPVLLPLPHPALRGTLALPWLPQSTDPTPAAPAAPYEPARAYVGGNAVAYGAVRWRCLLGEGQSTVAGTPPRLTPVPVRLPLNLSALLVAWELVPYATANEELPTCALLAPAPLAPDLLARADAPAPASFAPLRTLTRAGLTFDALLRDYHEGLRRALDPCRVLTLPLRLNPLDIAGLDFARPVRLDVAHVPGYGQLKGLFYLNDVDQYQPASRAAVPVTLLALGDAVPGLAPAAIIPIYAPGAARRALLLESGAPLLLESAQPILLES